MSLSEQAAEGDVRETSRSSENGGSHPVHPSGSGHTMADDLADALNRIVTNTADLLNVRNCSLALMEPTSSTLVTIATAQPTPRGQRRARFRLNEGVAGWVAANLTPVIIGDVSVDARFKELGPYTISSMMCAPLMSGQQLLGTITVSSPDLGAFNERKLKVLQMFADQAVFAISKVRQMAEALQQTGQLAALLDVSRAMTSTLDARQIFRAIVAGIRRLVRCDDAMIFGYDESEQELLVVAGMGLRSARLSDVRIRLSDTQSIAAWVAQKRRPLLHAPGEHNGMGQVTEAFLAGDDLALLSVPLMSKERLRGVVTLARPYPFDSSDLRAMLNLSNIVATALENAGLYQAVKAEQERLAAIFASSSDGIALIDQNQRIVEANQAFYAIQRHARSDNLLCREVLHCSRSGGHELCREGCMVLNALQYHRVVPIAEIEFTPPGNTRPARGQPAQMQKRQVALSITPVLADRGYQALVIARDTTPLREMDRMKANFISMVTHELRTPLNAINGYLDLALEGVAGELNERLHEFVRRARSSSEHLTSLVDDLLLISRADAGQFRLNRGQANLSAIVKGAIEEVELLAADANVNLVVQITPELPTFSGDEGRLKQVARNLLTNAIKFTPEGGQVTISGEVRGNQIEMVVSDTGRGISPEQLPRIFERFYQVARGQGSRGGQGLGLAIVKTIVERHQGSISVESCPGEGAAFTVSIPLNPPKPSGPGWRMETPGAGSRIPSRPRDS
ncbi:MAG TPA: ATP-binding protein [Ktedonobacterales bacterium]|jgi:signal transduction histidine kinase